MKVFRRANKNLEFQHFLEYFYTMMKEFLYKNQSGFEQQGSPRGKTATMTPVKKVFQQVSSSKSTEAQES